MKAANVVPILKDGDKHHYSNHRPISIFLQSSKIREKIHDKRLSKLVDKYHLLDESKYGFRKGRSNARTLMDLVEGITASLDNKKTTIGVFY